MHREIADRAGLIWGFDPAQILLAAQRENSVFRVTTETGEFALRLHRAGYRTENQLLSELQWMNVVGDGGITVPRPVPSKSGSFVHEVCGTLVDVLTWLPGQPIGARGVLHNVSDPAKLCYDLGKEMAKLHKVTDAWTPPENFSRPAWDVDGLLGDAPVWGPFWRHPDLSRNDQHDLETLRRHARQKLHDTKDDLDFGLIHADLITENIMHDNGVLALIDFDDCGFGFRTFELATFLIRFIDKPDYISMRTALVNGYAIRRQVKAAELDFFLMLRALTYLGWIIPRMQEPGAQDRSRLALQTALPLVRNYIDNQC